MISLITETAAYGWYIHILIIFINKHTMLRYPAAGCSNHAIEYIFFLLREISIKGIRHNKYK